MFRIDCILIEAEGKYFRASIYLSMEIIVAGALTLLTLPLMTRRKRSSPEVSARPTNPRRPAASSTTLLVDHVANLPPKYEDLFPEC